MKQLRLLNSLVVVIAGLIAAPIIYSAADLPPVDYAQLEGPVARPLLDALESGKGITRLFFSSHFECRESFG